MNIFNILSRMGEVNAGNLFKIPGSAGVNKEGGNTPEKMILKSSYHSSALSSITDVLNFALKLEHLEAAYYNQGILSGVITSADVNIFQQIRKHENAHVTFLQNTITALGGTPVGPDTYDFTAGGAFNPFFVYADFLALSQAFEDTGVRAYKGQAGNLITDNNVLTAALQIHSVEARHASEVRRLRTKHGMDSCKGWITNNGRGTLPPATQATYDGEQNTLQGGVDATSVTSAPSGSVTEAFDEPLTDTQVMSIVSPFIV